MGIIFSSDDMIVSGGQTCQCHEISRAFWMGASEGSGVRGVRPSILSSEWQQGQQKIRKSSPNLIWEQYCIPPCENELGNVKIYIYYFFAARSLSQRLVAPFFLLSLLAVITQWWHDCYNLQVHKIQPAPSKLVNVQDIQGVCWGQWQAWLMW